MRKKFVFATNNAHKLEEVSTILGSKIELLSMKDINCNVDIPETADTLEGNALIKAKYIFNNYHLDCFADDTGLEVEALNGAPGVYSARYAGEHGNDAANNEKLLSKLKPLRKENEVIDGMFVCVLALVQHAEDPLPQIFQGIWKGEILEAPRGENGFGYDPLFWLPELQLSSAEMNKEEKNKISHRGQAMQLFKASLEK